MNEQIKPSQEKINWDPNIDVYKNADLIIQTTNKCSKGCDGCIVADLGPKIELDTEKYLESIGNLKENNLIALRGGEITLIDDWFEKFIVSALNKKLKIILESNGYFIGTEKYNEILKKIANDQIFIRISFDLMHLKKGNADLEFNKMATFAKDAENNKINFGFYSCGMNENEIKNFTNGTVLEPYLNKFHSLIKYSNASEVKLKGKYLNAKGDISDKMDKLAF